MLGCSSAKAEAGADFAVTQLFFRSDDYFALVDRVRAAGSDIPILPGIMPVTNLGSVRRMAELSGARGAGVGAGTLRRPHRAGRRTT